MKGFRVFKRVGPQDLVKGDRVIAIYDTGYLSSSMVEETFRRLEISETGAMHILLGKKSELTQIFAGSATEPSNWRFYRKQMRA